MYSIDSLIFDLKNIDADVIKDKINKQGWDIVARNLGYDTTQYENLQLAGRMIIYSLKKKLTNNLNKYLDRMKDYLSNKVYMFYIEHIEDLQYILEVRENKGDLKYDWFSANSLIKTYITKLTYDSNEPLETPFQLWLRIAVSTYINNNLTDIENMFNELCDQYYIPASPTIFNSGLKHGQLASCFLLTVDDDLDSIFIDGTYNMAKISKNNGGIGIDISRLRHSKISNKGSSSGLLPWIYLYNATIRAVNQGGKRKGACTVYCRPHHIDIYEFCEASLKIGDNYMRAHDLNFAIWFPWLFWERVKKDDKWTLMCPAENKELNDIWGLEWEYKYQQLEEIAHNVDGTKKNMRVVKARDLLKHIVKIQRQSGMPYILHGDSINMKSNQKNLGYIRCANLCLEICEYTDTTEIAACNLTSINLKSFVIKPFNGNFIECYNFDKLGKIVRNIVKNLNKIIDNTYYPLDQIKKSNIKNRPMGIGVSGFAEMLHELDLYIFSDKDNSMVNEDVRILNKMIFSCIYWNALIESILESIRLGPYENFDDSPLSIGKLQFDLWSDEYNILESLGRIDHKIRNKEDDIPIEPISWGQNITMLFIGTILKNWNDMKKAIIKYGVRNSLLIALMPTATSAQPLRNGESVEMHQSNIYSRKVLNGAYPVLNRYLVKDLSEIGLWNNYTIELIQADNGSISKLKKYIETNSNKYVNYDPKNNHRLEHIIKKYKTMWELSCKIFLQLAADRGRYICQSQSTNIYLYNPTDEQLMAIHNYTNRLGLKTGMYYLREGAAVSPIKFTVDPKVINFVKCTDEVCVVCQ